MKFVKLAMLILIAGMLISIISYCVHDEILQMMMISVLLFWIGMYGYSRGINIRIRSLNNRIEKLTGHINKHIENSNDDSCIFTANFRDLYRRIRKLESK